MSTPRPNRHPNRNWRRRWSVDLLTGVARHDSGFAVQLTPLTTGGVECVPLQEAEGVKEATTNDYAKQKARLMEEAVEQYRVVLAKHQRGAG